MTSIRGRFAPTTSGRAHPGTLLAAQLAWLDARSLGGSVVLRWEDIDPTALDRASRQGLAEDLSWFGLDWDDVIFQSERRTAHEQCLDTLAEQGRLYACSCSRTTVRSAGLPSASGGWVYPGTCRHRVVRDWRSCHESLRVNLSDQIVVLKDESGLDLSQNIESAMGDPVVRRPDGGITYQLAVVADDEYSKVNRVVRGRDIATSTATQIALRRLLGWSVPTYRHHLLLLEPQGEKLAKLHQSIAAPLLRQYLSADAVRGFLAFACGLRDRPEPVSPPELLREFSWDRVVLSDQTIVWQDQRLRLL